MWNMEIERELDNITDPLVEDEDGLYLPTDEEIDQWQRNVEAYGLE